MSSLLKTGGDVLLRTRKLCRDLPLQTQIFSPREKFHQLQYTLQPISRANSESLTFPNSFNRHDPSFLSSAPNSPDSPFVHLPRPLRFPTESVLLINWRTPQPHIIMPASRPAGRIGGSRNSAQSKGYARAVLDEFTNPENRSVLLAIGIFTVSYDFQLALHTTLHSFL
jgi:hypothetical protein